MPYAEDANLFITQNAIADNVGVIRYQLAHVDIQHAASPVREIRQTVPGRKQAGR
jgi:hypothetical protein